jgi:tetratricopeptide (TPR) repeat protein
MAVSARFQEIAGAHEEALVSAQAAFDIAEQLQLDEIRAHALTTIGMAKYDLGDATGIDDMDRALEIALSIDSPVAATIVNNLGVYGQVGGDIARADDYYAEAQQLAERFGDNQTVRFVRGNRIWSAYLCGRWNEAHADADAFIAECETGSPHSTEWVARTVRATLREGRGDPDGALADNLRALDLVRATEETRQPAQLAGALGLLAATRVNLGDLAEARTLLLEAVPLVRRYGAMGSLIAAAIFAEELGVKEELQAAVADAPWPQTQHRWREAILIALGGDLRSAADFVADMGSPTLEARFRLYGGVRLLEEGRLEEGEVQLRRALAFYVDVDAPAYVERIERALAEAHRDSA